MNLLKSVYAVIHGSEPTYLLYLMQLTWPPSGAGQALVPSLFLAIFNADV